MKSQAPVAPVTHVVKAAPSAPPGWKLPSPLMSRQRPIVAPWSGWFVRMAERSPTLWAVMVLPARTSAIWLLATVQSDQPGPGTSSPSIVLRNPTK